MTSQTDIDVTNVCDIIGYDLEEVHHHARISIEEFMRKVQYQENITALCGYSKKASTISTNNKPCCPSCNKLLRKPCGS